MKNRARLPSLSLFPLAASQKSTHTKTSRFHFVKINLLFHSVTLKTFLETTRKQKFLVLFFCQIVCFCSQAWLHSFLQTWIMAKYITLLLIFSLMTKASLSAPRVISLTTPTTTTTTSFAATSSLVSMTSLTISLLSLCSDVKP